MKKSVINSAHPGEIIFSPGRYMQLYTSSITPAMCGFIPGESHIDKFLSSVNPSMFTITENLIIFLSVKLEIVCSSNFKNSVGIGILKKTIHFSFFYFK